VRGAVLRAVGEPLAISEDLRLRDPDPGKVRVALKASGVCHFRRIHPERHRSWALSNSEHCPVGGPERSWVTWSGGMPREAVAVFRHGRGRR
jgi:hypothetical protein